MTWGSKAKPTRKLEPADQALMDRLVAADAALPESRRVTATLVWIKSMLTADSGFTRMLGRGALTRQAEDLL